MSSRFPEVQMWDVSKSCRKTRESVFGLSPKLPKLSCVNYPDLYAVDSFYLECQKYRDYYRDPYDKLQRPTCFVRTGRRPVKTDLLSMPISWPQDSKPLAFAIDYGTDLTLGKGFQIVGRHSRFHDTSFTR